MRACTSRRREGSALPVFQRIFADIGDEQSIAANLSTFSAHLATIVEMTRDLAAPALVLLDEVGAGTDPTEGGALGVAIVDHFRARGAMVVATTHHGLMKAYAQSTPGVACASFGYDPDDATSRPTGWRWACPGRSLALEMAERLGLPAAVVPDARARLRRQGGAGRGAARRSWRREQAALAARARAHRGRARRRHEERGARSRARRARARRPRSAREIEAFAQGAAAARRGGRAQGRGRHPRRGQEARRTRAAEGRRRRRRRRAAEAIGAIREAQEEALARPGLGCRGAEAGAGRRPWSWAARARVTSLGVDRRGDERCPASDGRDRGLAASGCASRAPSCWRWPAPARRPGRRDRRARAGVRASRPSEAAPRSTWSA